MPASDPPYDAQLPFYGPGALACWYLALLCGLLTWTFHPTKSFVHLRLTPDVAFYALYACLAAGHLAVLISRFSDDDIRAMKAAGALGWNDARFHRFDVLERLGAEVRGMVVGVNVAFRVGVYFVWAGGWMLGAVVGSKMFWPEKMRWVRRREAVLPWVVAVAEGWVVGCFGFVATRVGFWAVVGAFLEYSIFMGILFGASMLGLYVVVISALSMYTLPRYEIWPEMKEFWRIARVTGEGYYVYLFSIGYWSLVIMPSLFGQEAAGVWALYWVVPLWGFPDLGVSMTGLDQILALCTGLVAVTFISSSVVQSRFGDWKSFLIWVRDEWEKRRNRTGKEQKRRVEASTDPELADLPQGRSKDAGVTTGWRYG